ncbi:AAA family ATPase [Shewanella sp. C32]|uniref:AAA family ATPase n=1 Tax=Shewanella electrica TaxID=515560 RepID=A0ABT2FGZ2_9GAMM|nr:ExeA family protein [Shewanella electrica]MCH1925376.1 AAA family ATPase [Shewanella electrica]MCS4555201.1 AAA family ATPase [Shewanella electrica]
MYKAFFGLSDNPFSIAPNPSYLFLSDRHREALAHLTYGLGETGGFVLLTGEVGTGKTTVSRCLLRQLPENTDTAFILNPSLTELELLATLCDELGIKYGENPTLKQLTDLISQFLLNNHQAGRNTVMIIDEAQHLRAEVLEQLRLLTNLETDTKKLLQVILIGQPELQHLLKRQELRQLAQRITARYHLLPLTEQEISLYVQHRLRVAGRSEPLFNQGAIKALHRYSGGIPRVINLLCERALMAAYGQNRTPINKQMVAAAATEVLGEPVGKGKAPWLWGSAAGVLVAAIATGVWWWTGADHLAAAPAETVVNATVQPAVPPQTNVASQLLTSAIAKSQDIDTAYAGLFALWGEAPFVGVSACQSAQQLGMVCAQQQGTLPQLIALNYPAVVYLKSAEQLFYGVLVKKQQQQLLLQLNEQQFWVSQSWFEQHYIGTYEVLAKKTADTPAQVTPSANLEQVQWLENSLAKAQQRSPRAMSYFDSELAQSLQQFQTAHQLPVDGRAAADTIAVLALYNSHQGPQLVAGDRS